MYYVYILQSAKDGKLYFGYTNDLRSRVAQHNRGETPSTKNRRPLKLVYYESYINRYDAKRRELFLKGGKGHRELKVQLRDTFRLTNYRYSGRSTLPA
ncbi:MAG: GIY-YIG nuclease family protein [Candidatus Kerfeldbacteria bacterium]|nr:GIY-YIG nuclease family protein [Candidatus Kerfeldbacteria bacterium]